MQNLKAVVCMIQHKAQDTLRTIAIKKYLKGND